MTARAGFPPQVFLVGAQKCATTFLADCLARHPEVELAHPKEPHYYTVNYSRGADWYRGCFRQPDARVLLDASTSYSAAPTAPGDQRADNPRHGVPARIHRDAPDARIVYVVRDPVRRAHSAYWHDVRAGVEASDFRAALGARSWYLDASRYGFQLARYLEVFPRERVLVLEIGEVTRDTARTVRRVWRFMGVPDIPGFTPDTSERNAGYRFNALGGLLARNEASLKLLGGAARIARRAMPAAAYRAVRAGLTRKIPEISAADAGFVATRLAEDMARFAELTGIDYRGR